MLSVVQNVCVSSNYVEFNKNYEFGKKISSLSYFLADRTATQYSHNTVVRPSVWLSVTFCIVALRVGVQG